MHYLDYSMIAIYMAIVIGIGFYFSRGENNSEDYLLGGRRMPFFAVGISCMMSLLSSVSIVVIPGEIYRNGLTLFFMAGMFGVFFSIPAYLLFVRFYFKLGSFTPYEYLEYRYDRKVRGLIALASLYTRILYIGTVLFTSSKIFEGAYGWEPWVTILLVGSVGVIYTILGGMKAVVWSDVIQFVVLVGGFIITIVILCSKIDGGPFGAVSYAIEKGHGIQQFGQAEFYQLTPYVRLTFWMLLMGLIISPLTSACSDQITIQRYLSTKDWKAGLKSQIVSSLTAWPFMMMLWFVGLALFTFYAQNPDPGLKDADGVFFHFIANNLPTPLPGIFMAAMLAAIMSTLDSGMNSMATIWLKEFHQKFINKKMDDRSQVKVSRYATFIIGATSITLGILLNTSGKWLAQSAAEIGVLFNYIAAIIMPAFLFAVLSPRASTSLVWGLTFFSLGDSLGAKFWYAASRAVVNSWKIGEPLSWGGPLDYLYVLLPMIVGIILVVPFWLQRKQAHKGIWARISALAGAVVLGFFQAMLTWYIFSNTLITTEPLSRSFRFGLPMTLIVGFIALWLSPKQPREKYQGLTLGTINEPILGKKDG